MKASEIPNIFQADARIMFETSNGYIVSKEQMQDHSARLHCVYRVAVVRMDKLPECKHPTVVPRAVSGWACQTCDAEMEPIGFKVKERKEK